MMIVPSRRRLTPHPARLLPLLALLSLLPGLTGCSVGLPGARHPRPPRVLHLAAIFPTTGVDGPLGRAVQRGVELAVRQHVRLAKGYRLALTRMNEVDLSPVQMGAILRQRQVLSTVGLLDNASMSGLVSVIEQQQVPTISPASLLPGLPARHNGSAGGQPTLFFPLSSTDDIAGKLAANVAVGPTLAAQTVFLVDDGSVSGRTLTGAFAAELMRRGRVIAGHVSTTSRDPTNVQTVVTAIIRANPTLVFYAGGTAAGADLRRTLSQTGAPLLRMLTIGAIANHPGWAAAVGGRAISAHTIGILPAPDLSTIPRARRFQSAYHRAFPGQVLLPQTGMAYDAAMDEIRAMQALIRAGKRADRRAVDTILAGSRYRGIMGPLDFSHAESQTLDQFSLYSCDSNGIWRYQGVVKQGHSVR